MKKLIKLTAVLLSLVLTLTLSVGVSADDVSSSPDDINIESTAAINDGSVVDDNIDINSDSISTELIEGENSTRSQTSGIVSGAVYRIKNVGSGKYMNVHNGVDANGTNIYQWTGDGSTEQKFRIVYFADSDAYLIYAMCSSSGRVLDIYDPGGVLAHGENVKLYTATEPNSQLVKIVSLGQNQYRISMKTNSNLYLAAYGNSNGTSGGTTATSAGNIYLSNYVGEMYQHWMFELVENPPNPTGNLEEVSASRIKGWAYQTGLPDRAINVHIYIKNNSTGAQNTVALTANQYRADLQSAGYGDGEHAFNHTMNWCAYPSGTYTVSAYGINNNGGTNPHLSNSPRTFTVRKATGAMDEINDSLVRGWAWKPDAPNDSVQVHLYIRRTNGETVYQTAAVANTYRGDLYNAGYGDGEHGFSIPIDWSSLPEERLRVTLYAVDGSNENPIFYDEIYNNTKQISLLGMLESKYFHDFSAWSRTDDVATYCENIGCSYLYITNRADYNIYTNSIKRSSYCVIFTHGYPDGEGIEGCMKDVDNNHLNCEADSCIVCFPKYENVDISSLPDNYFDTTRCVVLMACYSGLGGSTKSDNMVNALHAKGVWTVVGFEGQYYYRYDNNHPNPEIHTDDVVNTNLGAQRWMTEFTKFLGQGFTVDEAKNEAYDVTIFANLTANNYTKYDLNHNLIPEPIKTEAILCGLDKCYIAGDKNQIVKH